MVVVLVEVLVVVVVVVATTSVGSDRARLWLLLHAGNSLEKQFQELRDRSLSATPHTSPQTRPAGLLTPASPVKKKRGSGGAGTFCRTVNREMKDLGTATRPIACLPKGKPVMVLFWKTGADGNSVNRDLGGRKDQVRSPANPLSDRETNGGTTGGRYGTFNIIRCRGQGLSRTLSLYLPGRAFCVGGSDILKFKNKKN